MLKAVRNTKVHFLIWCAVMTNLFVLFLSSCIHVPSDSSSSAMSVSDLVPQPRGVDYNLPTCGETQCNSHGTCEVPPGGGGTLVCNCHLGYQGETCKDTVNGSLSLPLTLSVLAVIIGLLVIGFIFAKLRQKQKRQRR